MVYSVYKDFGFYIFKLDFPNNIFHRKAISLINRTYKQIELFGTEESKIIEEEGKFKTELEAIKRNNDSFHTNSTSTANFKAAFGIERSKKFVGIIFKCNLNDLMRKTFLLMKEMGIVWKSWNSEYIYKCQSIPYDTLHLKNKSKSTVREDVEKNVSERMQEFYQNDLIKFFLHFSAVPKRKDILDLDPKSKNEYEYLISFIWIKGNTLTFLDFVTQFRNNIQNRV
jgi:uncharacterized protein YlzI (FlbEa/FlbD family)